MQTSSVFFILTIAKTLVATSCCQTYFMPSIKYLNVYWCQFLFKFSNALNCIFSDVITDDFTCILMMTTTKSNWQHGVIFGYMSWYISFWWKDFPPPKNMPYYHNILSPVLYPANAIYLWFNFIVALIDSNTDHSIFSL